MIPTCCRGLESSQMDLGGILTREELRAISDISAYFIVLRLKTHSCCYLWLNSLELWIILQVVHHPAMKLQLKMTVHLVNLSDVQWFSVIPVILSDVQWFWAIFSDSERYSVILSDFHWFWAIFSDSERCSVILSNVQWFWAIFSESEWYHQFYNPHFIYKPDHEANCAPAWAFMSAQSFKLTLWGFIEHYRQEWLNHYKSLFSVAYLGIFGALGYLIVKVYICMMVCMLTLLLISLQLFVAK